MSCARKLADLKASDESILQDRLLFSEDGSAKWSKTAMRMLLDWLG